MDSFIIEQQRDEQELHRMQTLNQVLKDKILAFKENNPDPAKKAADALRAVLLKEVESIKERAQDKLAIMQKQLELEDDECTDNQAAVDELKANETQIKAQIDALQAENEALKGVLGTLLERQEAIKEDLKRKQEDAQQLEKETGKLFKKKKKFEDTERKTAQKCDDLTVEIKDLDGLLVQRQQEADQKNENMKEAFKAHEATVNALKEELANKKQNAKAEYEQKFRDYANERRVELKHLLDEKKREKEEELKQQLASALPADLDQTIATKQKQVEKLEQDIQNLAVAIQETQANIPDRGELQHTLDQSANELIVWEDKLAQLKADTEYELRGLLAKRETLDEDGMELEQFRVDLDEQLNDYQNLLHVKPSADGLFAPTTTPSLYIDHIRPAQSSLGVRNNTERDVDIGGWMIRVRYTDETVDASGYDLPGTQHITYTFSGPAIVSPDQLYTLTTDEHERSTHDEVWEIQDDSLDVWAYRTVYLELLDADKLLVSTAVVRQCARRE